MEIRLAKIFDNFPKENIKVEFLDFITEEQFKTFEYSISALEELHSVRRLRDFVVINEKELIELLNSALYTFLSKSGYWNAIKRNDTDQCFLNSNRLLLNYLSSIRTFIDHSSAFVKRKYGETSQQFLEFEKILSLFYDNSFAYRFFYKLRNYSQHVGIPLDSFSYNTEHNMENDTIEGTLKVTFNRDKLLGNYNSWGTVKKDLEKMKPEFDITPLLFEMTHNINEIERNIEILQKKELLEAASFISELTTHLKDDQGEIIVAYDFQEKENGELASYSSIHIPFDTIEFILNRLNK